MLHPNVVAADQKTLKGPMILQVALSFCFCATLRVESVYCLTSSLLLRVKVARTRENSASPGLSSTGPRTAP